MFSSLLSMVESKKVSDRQTMSKLLVVIKASTNGTLIKSWTASLFKFQWKNLMLDDLFGPGLTSIFPDNKCRRYLKLFIKTECSKRQGLPYHIWQFIEQGLKNAKE